jgi:hypothetical protein
MPELQFFYNTGFGWTCRQCEKELSSETDRPSRLLAEGEGEYKLSGAVAKWADASQRMLVCPRCGVTEWVEKS